MTDATSLVYEPLNEYRRTTNDFYAGVLCVLCIIAIVLSAVIGVAATVALGKNPLGPDRALANAVGGPGGADDYVEGLERLGTVLIRMRTLWRFGGSVVSMGYDCIRQG